MATEQTISEGVLVRPPYGIHVYPGAIPQILCKNAVDYFESQEKWDPGTLVNDKPQTFAQVELTEQSMARHPIMSQVLRRIEDRMNSYFDEYIAQPELRSLVKKGRYSLQPRMKRYDKGDEFPIHADSSSIMTQTRQFAYIVYLNDNFEGGDTVFSNAKKEIGRIKPVEGSMAVFPVHSIYMHQGEKIREGSKYILNGFCNSFNLSRAARRWLSWPKN